MAGGSAEVPAQLDRASFEEDVPLTALMLGQAAANGNTAAKTILSTATEALGWAIAQVMAIVDPDIVIVGGGVSLMGEKLFYQPLRESVARYLFPSIGNDWQVVSPALNEEVVVHGAVALARFATSPESESPEST